MFYTLYLYMCMYNQKNITRELWQISYVSDLQDHLTTVSYIETDKRFQE